LLLETISKVIAVPRVRWISRHRRRYPPQGSEVDDGANALAFVHQIERRVDLIQTHGVSDKSVQRDLAALRFIHVAGQLGAALDPTEGRTAPDPAGHQLERTGTDFLAGTGHTDDHRLAPALVRA